MFVTYHFQYHCSTNTGHILVDIYQLNPGSYQVAWVLSHRVDSQFNSQGVKLLHQILIIPESCIHVAMITSEPEDIYCLSFCEVIVLFVKNKQTNKHCLFVFLFFGFIYYYYYFFIIFTNVLLLKII